MNVSGAKLSWVSVAVLLLLTACGGRLLNVRLGPLGVKLLVDDGIAHDLEAEEGEVSPGQIGEILGHPLSIHEDGAISWGDRHYGTVAGGATVRVSEEGIHVDGEHRGERPSAQSER